jgi:hypothetical protein
MNLTMKKRQQKFKNLLLCVFLNVISQSTFGEELEQKDTISQSSQSLLNTNETHPFLIQRNIRFDGNFYSEYSNNSGQINLIAFSTEYFLNERLSIGGTIRNFESKLISRSGFGPSVSYTILKLKSVSPVLGLELLNDLVKVRNIESKTMFNANIKFGFDWFIHTNISIGPFFSFGKPLRNYFNQEGNTVRSLFFRIAVYL